MKTYPISACIEAGSKALVRGICEVLSTKVVDPNSPLLWALGLALLVALGLMWWPL